MATIRVIKVDPHSVNAILNHTLEGRKVRQNNKCGIYLMTQITLIRDTQYRVYKGGKELFKDPDYMVCKLWAEAHGYEVDQPTPTHTTGISFRF